jgi:hypothetical protein
MKSFEDILRISLKEEAPKGSLTEYFGDNFPQFTIDDFPNEKQKLETYQEPAKEQAQKEFNDYIEGLNNQLKTQANMQPAEIRGRGTRNAAASQTPEERIAHLKQTVQRTNIYTPSNQFRPNALMTDEERKGVQKMSVAYAGATAALLTSPLWAPLIPKLGGLLTKFGINLAKDKLDELIKAIIELFKGLFEEKKGETQNTAMADQLLQVDCQTIIMRAKQLQNDPYSQQVIGQLQPMLNTKITQTQETPKDQAVSDKSPSLPGLLTESVTFQKILEWSIPGVAQAKQAVGTVMNAIAGGTPNTQNIPSQDMANKQMTGLKNQNIQQQNLRTDCQNLQKKAKIVGSEYAQKILQAVQSLI